MQEIRRKDRIMDYEDSIKLLANGEYGILSMVTLENTGDGVPLNYIFEDNKIYIHCAVEGRKLESFINNPNVSFCVVGKTQVQADKFSTIYESVIAFGKISESEDIEKREALIKILAKYSPEHMENGIKYIDAAFNKVKIFRIDVTDITAKAKMK